MNSQQLAEKITSIQATGKFFTVWFTKKDGTERRMTCRFGVKKHLKGGKSYLDEKKFFTVWDSGAKGYRAVNKETILKVKIGGVVYE